LERVLEWGHGHHALSEADYTGIIMTQSSLRWLRLLMMVALSACATAPPPADVASSTEEPMVSAPLEELCAEGSSVVALCAEDQCGLYRCRQVKEYLTMGRVLPALDMRAPLTNPQAGAQRNWGSAQESPWDARPVFIIPWGHKPPLLPSQQELLAKQAEERRKPHEKHHIFPRMFKTWFEEKGIDIDEYVLPLEVGKHRSIHRGANGGPWNEAWRTFIERNRKGATKEAIYRYAGKLIYEFELFGPIVPLWKQPPPLPSGY
jgi:uncharacterized lipoprotein (TIGR02269 family)